MIWDNTSFAIENLLDSDKPINTCPTRTKNIANPFPKSTQLILTLVNSKCPHYNIKISFSNNTNIIVYLPNFTEKIACFLILC